LTSKNEGYFCFFKEEQAIIKGMAGKKLRLKAKQADIKKRGIRRRI